MEQPTAKRSLEITNAEHIGYKYGGIEITILGGIRLEGLDRMRSIGDITPDEMEETHEQKPEFYTLEVS